MVDKYKQVVQKLLRHADIKINGNRPYDIKVKDKRFYKRVLAEGSLGLGESYMDGWWDCDHLDQFFDKVTGEVLLKEAGLKKLIIPLLKTTFFNLQTRTRSKKVGEQHYDVGNELYKKMLDKRMLYTCGYWKNAKTLDAAQEAKLDLICKKIGLKPGMKVLDIGCGWGSFAKYAAEKYKVKVLGVTISKEQVKLGKKLCKGLPVEIRLQDYRDVKGKYDRVVSIGLTEHIGRKNYKGSFKKVHSLLKDDGLFLLHTIGSNFSKKVPEKWIEKYIFPGCLLPSPKQLTSSFEKLFILEDWHNFGADYDKTLMAWHKNFNKSWDKISDCYDERFKRMWNYYLLACAGAFRSRTAQLWQIVFSKKGVRGGYKSLR